MLEELRLLRIEISPKKCSQLGAGNNGEREIDRSRVLFIVRSKFRKATKNRFLGYAWLVLDPFVISMIYLFVFSVVKANPDASSILVGVTMYRVFQGSLMNGLNCIGDLNGGFKSERIVTKVIVSAEFLHRVIDVFLQTSLIALIMVVGFDAKVLGVLIFIFIAQLMGLLTLGLGTFLSPIVQKIPDLRNVISYALRIGFYASPAMYPMERMEGLHYKINEYNPFAYFAELARECAGVSSSFFELEIEIFGLINSVLILCTVIGISRLDSLRWRMTNWS